MEGEFLVYNDGKQEEEKENDERSDSDVVSFREVNFSLRDNNGKERSSQGKGYVKKVIEWFEVISLVVVGVYMSNEWKRS